MKKSVLIIAFSMILAISGLTSVRAQEQPAPVKDTVNMDTEAKPTQYYEVEDDKSTAGAKSGVSVTLILGIIVAVVVVGGVAYTLLKKKK
jgi:cobalamin biosynthesis Mg chelatase CobN